MKKLFWFFAFLGSGLLLFSCYTERPLTKGPSGNNETYKVHYLFEHDGCKVYRFYDMGHYVYFTNCTGNVTAIQTDSTAHRTQTTTYNI